MVNPALGAVDIACAAKGRAKSGATLLQQDGRAHDDGGGDLDDDNWCSHRVDVEKRRKAEKQPVCRAFGTKTIAETLLAVKVCVQALYKLRMIPP